MTILYSWALSILFHENSTAVVLNLEHKLVGMQLQANPRRISSGMFDDVVNRLFGRQEKVVAHLGTNTLLTAEWTPLEPGTLDHKMYVRGVGIVLEQTERGPNERNELVSFVR